MGKATSSLRADPVETRTPQHKPNGAGTFAYTPVASSGWPGSLILEEEVLSPGARLDKYRIQASVGCGALGHVYRAEDSAREQTVALKVLRKGMAGDSFLEHLRREAAVLAGLAHPSVVGAAEVGRDHGHLYLAMEWVRGKALPSYLLQSRPDCRALLDLFSTLGAALSAAHDAGVLHRDFKPGNVIIDAQGFPRLLDFGLAAPQGFQGAARARASSTNSQAVVQIRDNRRDQRRDRSGLVSKRAALGTLGYMAPELWRGQPASPASDQYSYAVSFYQALTGLLPSYRYESNGSGSDQGAAILVWPTDADFPAASRAALERALQPWPDQRFPSMPALLAELGTSSARHSWSNLSFWRGHRGEGEQRDVGK